MKVDAIIPIKRHSERVPNKNFRLLNNKPLYMYIIESLIDSKYISKIYIDTDARDKLEHLTKIPSVEIINRPEHLLGDRVSVNKLIEYDLQFIESDVILQTHVTNPFLKTKTIDSVIEYYINYHHSIFGVTEFNNRFWTTDGKPINHNSKKLLRSQDVTPIFLDNSCFYLFTKDFFKKVGLRMDETSIPIVVSKKEALDIDNEFDWELAGCLVKQL